ncbi:hypothetical protein AG1IA_02512 [Rhizoctonia solani AG-1 IA]|uniref:Uncharacterized protein n=1 Tax=Thanatephorus cucumeris (strain AG1-IA) TaxID=983506 RepID=L8WZE0_THACA|nr:hypothetical protein AG1IA_02512 [Rhizoctonia solani AG-1 IA]
MCCVVDVFLVSSCQSCSCIFTPLFHFFFIISLLGNNFLFLSNARIWTLVRVSP